MCFGGAAVAQTTTAAASSSVTTPAGETAQEIVVTGSRISRRDLTSDTPIVTVGADVLQSTGQTTLETGLNLLLQLSPSSSASASQATNGGQANLDLRGIGTARTLVLVNGKRMVPSLANGTVDVNDIPSALVESVEVITGGASAVYGSDAIAGVVNIKLKRHFTGVELDAQYGASTEGDAGSTGFTAVVGSDFAQSKGNGYIAFDYAKREGVTGAARSYLAGYALSTNLPYGDILASASNLPSQAALNSVFAKYGVAPGTVKTTSSLLLSTNPDGTLFNITGAVNYRGKTTPPTYIYKVLGDHGATSSTLGVVDAAENYLQIQSPLERYNLVSHGDYDVGHNITLFADGLFTHYTNTTTQNPATLGSSCCLALTVPVTNPFIPADLATLLASRPNPNANFNITSQSVWAGPRTDNNAFDVFQLTGGARGSMAFHDISWEAYAIHGRTAYQDTLTGYASLAAINTLLSAPGGGTALCTGGFNPFGLNTPSASCYNYLSRTGHNNTYLTQDVFELDTQGSLFNVPAGEARFAAGLDYRKNTYVFDADSQISAGDLSNTPKSFSTHGSTAVKEVYVELLLPVVKDLPFAKSINLDLGYRYSDYDLSGGVSTYKADADWKVVDWLTFRGGYARATRAPSVGDLYQAVSGSQVTIGGPGQFNSGDPCDVAGAYLSAAKNPDAAKVSALCTAQGVPANFTNTQPRPPVSSQGNLALQPETADSFSVGFVLRSRFEQPLLSKLSLTVDYYSIDVTNTIGTVGANAVLDDCYSGATNPTYSITNTYCAALTRNPANGLISNISNPLLNLGEYKTAGYDVQLDWSAPLKAFGLPDGFGRVSLNVLANYLDTFTIQSTQTSAALEFAGTIGNTQVDQYADAHPKWKGVTSLGWQIGPVQSSLRWRYLDGMKNAAFVGTASTGPGAPATSYYDLDASWVVRPGLTIRAGVSNLFDKNPPSVPFMSAGTDPYTYDLIGRTVFISLKAKL